MRTTFNLHILEIPLNPLRFDIPATIYEKHVDLPLLESDLPNRSYSVSKHNPIEIFTVDSRLYELFGCPKTAEDSEGKGGETIHSHRR